MYDPVVEARITAKLAAKLSSGYFAPPPNPEEREFDPQERAQECVDQLVEFLGQLLTFKADWRDRGEVWTDLAVQLDGYLDEEVELRLEVDDYLGASPLVVRQPRIGWDKQVYATATELLNREGDMREGARVLRDAVAREIAVRAALEQRASHVRGERHWQFDVADTLLPMPTKMAWRRAFACECALLHFDPSHMALLEQLASLRLGTDRVPSFASHAERVREYSKTLREFGVNASSLKRRRAASIPHHAAIAEATD